jgi:hypothetical protein
LAKQQDDGKWLASCPICSWKQTFPTEIEAKNELNNHISINHQQGRKTVKEQKPMVPPKNMPPQIPAPIKER